MLRTLSIAAFILTVPVAAAQANNAQDVRACEAMAATIAPREAEIVALTAERDEVAASVERHGDAWEDAEIHRLASASHAAKADVAKAAYDEARKLLSRREMALQATVRQFNDDAEVFNSRCARR
ncbi:MAG: hypothetical protein ACK46Q_12665 [Hyphomonas sp.]